MKISLRKRILYACASGALLGIGGKLAYSYGDEIFLATDYERQVERNTRKQIFMNWSDHKIERDRKASLVERLYDDVKNNWDYFERQWNNLSWIDVDDSGERNIMVFHQFSNHLDINSNQKMIAPKEQDLVHELAHAWYSSLTLNQQDQFQKQWLQFSQDRYHHCETYDDPSCRQKHKSCPDFVREAATTSCYGADSFEEDVAEVVSTVYRLQKYGPTHPEMPSSILVDIDSLAVPRVLEKIALAADYGFYSPRERDTALELLRFQFRKR